MKPAMSVDANPVGCHDLSARAADTPPNRALSRPGPTPRDRGAGIEKAHRAIAWTIPEPEETPRA